MKGSPLNRGPHRITQETPTALWCADERGAVERGEFCTGELSRVTCTECIRWMEKTLLSLQRWDLDRKTTPGTTLAPGDRA